MDTIMNFLLQKYERVNKQDKKKARLYFYLIGILFIHSTLVLILALFIPHDSVELLYTFLSIAVYALLGGLLFNNKLNTTLYLFSVFAIARSVYLISMSEYLIFFTFLTVVILFVGLFQLSKKHYYSILSIPVLLLFGGTYYSVVTYTLTDTELFMLIESGLYLLVTITFLYLFSILLYSEITKSKKLHEKSTVGLLMKAHQRRTQDKINTKKAVDSRTTLLIVGIDQYHEINDEYGVDNGDNLLKEVINIIRNKIRIDDYIIRWNHEDFLVVLNFTPISNASIVAEKIRKVISTSEFDFLKKKVTVSIACVANRNTMQETIEKAEKLLQKNKTFKKDHVELDFN